MTADAAATRPAAAPLPAPPVPAAGGQAPARSRPALDGNLLAARVHDFLASRGVNGPPRDDPAEPSATAPAPAAAPPSAPPAAAPPPADEPPPEKPVEFVCEEDVRQAVRESRTILVDERTIITPAASDLAARHRALRYN